MQAASQQCVQALMQDMSLTTQPPAPARIVPTPDPVKASPPANTRLRHTPGEASYLASSARTDQLSPAGVDRHGGLWRLRPSRIILVEVEPRSVLPACSINSW